MLPPSAAERAADEARDFPRERSVIQARRTRHQARALCRESGQTRVLTLTAPDGMWAAGVAIAVMAHRLGSQGQPAGIYCIDERVRLSDVVDGMRAIDADCVHLSNSSA